MSTKNKQFLAERPRFLAVSDCIQGVSRHDEAPAYAAMVAN